MQNFLKVFNVSNKDTRKTLVKLHRSRFFSVNFE